jgi:hypothetical protein
MASPSIKQDRTGNAAITGRYRWKAIGKVVTIPADWPYPGAVTACHDAEAVVFDLVYPTRTQRRLFGWPGKAWLDAGTGTSEHGSFV